MADLAPAGRLARADESANRRVAKVRARRENKTLGREAAEPHQQKQPSPDDHSCGITFELFCSIKTINFQPLLFLINPCSLEILDSRRPMNRALSGAPQKSSAKPFAN